MGLIFVIENMAASIKPKTKNNVDTIYQRTRKAYFLPMTFKKAVCESEPASF